MGEHEVSPTAVVASPRFGCEATSSSSSSSSVVGSGVVGGSLRQSAVHTRPAEGEERSHTLGQQRQPPSMVRGFLDPAKGGLQVQPMLAERPSELEAMPPPSAPKKRKVYGAALP